MKNIGHFRQTSIHAIWCSDLYKVQKQNKTRNYSPHSQDDIPEVLVEEVEKTLMEMKNGMAAGNDEITVELLKYAERTTWKVLAKTSTNCLSARRILQEWNGVNTIIIHKKGNKEDIKTTDQ
ncbi:hypothetical protein WA026_015232 [Henosepilachna vigintioctopunctata]|uniref:Uncharacterized protein n=1 Tax=Henosepilachna vigintioctopunctata TaxID=420089 RepID=A0AAW1TUI4_9CUCU